MPINWKDNFVVSARSMRIRRFMAYWVNVHSKPENKLLDGDSFGYVRRLNHLLSLKKISLNCKQMKKTSGSDLRALEQKNRHTPHILIEDELPKVDNSQTRI